ELVAPRAPATPPAPATEAGPAPEVAQRPPAAPDPSAPFRSPTPPTPRAWRWSYRTPRPSDDVPVFRPETLPQGWLGIRLTCQDCGGEPPEGDNKPGVARGVT